MRYLTRLAAFAGTVAVAACASAGSPPGGPPDTAPPQVVAFSPDSGTVNFSGRAVIVTFDETITDRGTGASALEALVLISPRDGEPRVSWHRNRLAVRPRGGFRPNTAYSITIAPGITDLRSNRATTGRTVVFSTGPEVPSGSVSGRAFDWPGQQVARRAWVEALRTADSAVFVAPADSTGAFTIGALGPGTYVVRGYVDQNANRVLDRTEAWDSVRVTVGGAPATGVELLFAQRDSVQARLTEVVVHDSVTLRLAFDKPLDPAQAFAPGMVRVVRADSTPVALANVVTREAFDSLVRAAAPRDTSPRDPLQRIPVRDTAARVAPSRPAPPSSLVVTLAQALAPATTYRVTVGGVRTLTGVVSTATRVITTAVRDTTRTAPAPGARPDSQPPSGAPRRP